MSLCKPMTQDAELKREAIFTAAFTQFSRYGFRRTSMEDIAKEMGISRASLYSYFKNKEEGTPANSQIQKLQNKLTEHLCMVIPSIWEEPFGIVALEGIASCDVVISSNRGGLPEAVGSCGYLVDPTVNKLSEAMISVIKNRNDDSQFIGSKYFDQCLLHLSNLL